MESIDACGIVDARDSTCHGVSVCALCAQNRKRDAASTTVARLTTAVGFRHPHRRRDARPRLPPRYKSQDTTAITDGISLHVHADLRSTEYGSSTVLA